MTIFKSPKYPCLQTCNVGDAKIIDWICTKSKLNLNRTNTWRKQERQTTLHKDAIQKTSLRRRNHKKNEIDVKISYFSKRERDKRVKGVILGQKLTLNHRSLVDEGGKTSILVTAHKVWLFYLCVQIFNFYHHFIYLKKINNNKGAATIKQFLNENVYIFSPTNEKLR